MLAGKNHTCDGLSRECFNYGLSAHACKTKHARQTKHARKTKRVFHITFEAIAFKPALDLMYSVHTQKY